MVNVCTLFAQVGSLLHLVSSAWWQTVNSVSTGSLSLASRRKSLKWFRCVSLQRLVGLKKGNVWTVLRAALHLISVGVEQDTCSRLEPQAPADCWNDLKYLAAC